MEYDTGDDDECFQNFYILLFFCSSYLNALLDDFERTRLKSSKKTYFEEQIPT